MHTDEVQLNFSPFYLTTRRWDLMEYFQIDLQDSGTCDILRSPWSRWSSHPQLCQVPSCKKFGQTWSRNAGKRCLNCTWDHGSFVRADFLFFQNSRKITWEFLLTITSAVSVVWGVQTTRSRRFLCFGLFFFGLVGWSLVEFNDSSTWPKLNWWLDHWLIYWLYIDQLNSMMV